ncbi:Glycosyltransferase involved in cell wall bisynthesis [Lutibacter oricola]|uniref:Glycosyltransferase involved in cell wall bisynthesis n=1 Tax=Lutibacter oricola TaxID=762486 RepID=A0A1H2X1H5_9FLAO|nr:glycosyltransferase [Lutibacter oricola]SDW86730.1 Glycosyltransferase involved in cell wall bisynthesis [Lutibacter oricola]
MKEQLKVIQIIDSLTPGGAEMMAVNIANGLSRKGVDSYLCSTRKEGLLKSKISGNVKYLFLKKKQTLGIYSFRRLYRFIKKEKINIIHAHSSSIFIGFLMKLWNPKLTLIWHDHYGKSETLENRKSDILKVLAKKINFVIVVNDLLYQWNKKALRVKNVVNLSNFASINKQTKEVIKLKGEEGKRIVCLANFRPQKDHINLLKAFKIIHQDFNDWTLHLVGLDLNDEYSDSIKGFIKTNKLTAAIFSYGSVENTFEVLEQATIGVLASKSEGLPVSLLEYGLAKLPVVVTNVGDCNKLISNNDTGLLVPPNNKLALGEALKELIINSTRRKLFAENLNSLIVKKYSEDSYLDKLIAVYLKTNDE